MKRKRSAFIKGNLKQIFAEIKGHFPANSRQSATYIY